MNFEFIIGTVIGVAGLVLTWICSKEQIKSFFMPNMQVLLQQLADPKKSLKSKQGSLKKINKKLKIFGASISSDYINSFSLESKSTNAILRDICFTNKIEPTSDLCKAFLGCDSPTLRRDWKASLLGGSKAQEESPAVVKEVPPTSVIRPNTVYVSSILKEKFPKAAESLLTVLEKHNVIVKELVGTKDIWCRDYMPVQNRLGELIQFKYDPSYLKGTLEWEKSRSDVHDVCAANGINPIYSEINLDGGNVVLYGNKAILTDRIFAENPDYDKNKLLSELESLLKAKVIIIPAIKTDVTGHADGMVRFIDDKTILGNNLEIEYKYIRDGIYKACTENGLIYNNVPFFEQKHDKNHEMSAIGIYVNYLEVNNLIVIPKFGVDGNHDQEVEDLFRKMFPDRAIEAINYNEVALEGGILNCSTWTVHE